MAVCKQQQNNRQLGSSTEQGSSCWACLLGKSCCRSSAHLFLFFLVRCINCRLWVGWHLQELQAQLLTLQLSALQVCARWTCGGAPSRTRTWPTR